MGKDVIIACDFSSKKEVLDFLARFTGRKPYVKIGMELFYAEGPEIVKEIKKRGHKIFLDLKLHDIPNTVKKAMAVLSRLDVDMCNLHAGGTCAMMEAALEAGASDFASEDDVFEIYTEPEDLYAVEDALIAAGYTITSAEKDKIPSNYVTLETEDDIKYMGLLLDNLDENEDVVNVYHNWENQPED